MYLNPESYKALKSAKTEISRTRGKIVQTSNGRYKYIPSKEYMEMRANLEKKATHPIPKDSFIKLLKGAHKKLSNLNYAFKVAEETNRRVSHILEGKIVLV